MASILLIFFILIEFINLLNFYPSSYNILHLFKVLYVLHICIYSCSKCETVVNPPASILKEFCPRCECKWQRRNTKTIKVSTVPIYELLELRSALGIEVT